jgi:hypothetical protein
MGERKAKIILKKSKFKTKTWKWEKGEIEIR